MAQIDSVASAGAAALQQFQPRPQNDAGTDNRSVPQFQQLLQTQPSAPAQETQTQVAVQQPEPPQNLPAPQPSAGNTPGGNTQSLSEILRDANERQAARDESPASPSALNYNANGAANAAQRPSQAGQLVSLTV